MAIVKQVLYSKRLWLTNEKLSNRKNFIKTYVWTRLDVKRGSRNDVWKGKIRCDGDGTIAEKNGEDEPDRKEKYRAENRKSKKRHYCIYNKKESKTRRASIATDLSSTAGKIAYLAIFDVVWQAKHRETPEE